MYASKWILNWLKIYWPDFFLDAIASLELGHERKWESLASQKIYRKYEHWINIECAMNRHWINIELTLNGHWIDIE